MTWIKILLKPMRGNDYNILEGSFKNFMVPGAKIRVL
jgi:hypothetical protein